MPLGRWATYGGTEWVSHNCSDLSVALPLPRSSHPSFAKFYSFCLLSFSCFYPLISIPIASIPAHFLISYCPGFCKIPVSGNDHFIHDFFWFIVFQRYNFPNLSQIWPNSFFAGKTFIGFYCSQNKIQNPYQFLNILICSFLPHSFLWFSMTFSLSSSTTFIKVVPSLNASIFSFHLEHISPVTAQWVSFKLKYFMNWLFFLMNYHLHANGLL